MKLANVRGSRIRSLLLTEPIQLVPILFYEPKGAMLGYEDPQDAAAGEERDALMRAFAEDMAEVFGRERSWAG